LAPALLQLLRGVLPHWFERPVAYPATLLVGLRHDQRLLDQPSEDLHYILGNDAPRRAWIRPYRLRHLQREATNEHRQPAEQDLLLIREQLVAPVKGRPHRPLTLREVPSPDSR